MPLAAQERPVGGGMRPRMAMGSPASASEPATRRFGNATTGTILCMCVGDGFVCAAGLLEQPLHVFMSVHTSTTTEKKEIYDIYDSTESDHRIETRRLIHWAYCITYMLVPLARLRFRAAGEPRCISSFLQRSAAESVIGLENQSRPDLPDDRKPAIPRSF